MGTQNSYTQQLIQQKLQMQHPKFKHVRTLKNNQQEYMQIDITIAHEKQYQQWKKDLKFIPRSIQDILLVPVQHNFEKSGICGSSGNVIIRYEYFPFLLSEEINNRFQAEHKVFDQPQLWYLMYSLLSACNAFHTKGRKLGDIRPETIFINDKGQLAISNKYSWPSQYTNYQKTKYQGQITYLSPEQLSDLAIGKSDFSGQFQIAEAFSIGLTVLDATILSNSNDLYLDKYQFSKTKLDNKLQTLRNSNYSKIFIFTVLHLCLVQCFDRSNCHQMFKWLQPSEKNIVNLENFIIKDVPIKMRKTIELQKQLNQNRITASFYSPQEVRNIQSNNNIPVSNSNINTKFSPSPVQKQFNNPQIQSYTNIYNPHVTLSSDTYFDKKVSPRNNQKHEYHKLNYLQNAQLIKSKYEINFIVNNQNNSNISKEEKLTNFQKYTSQMKEYLSKIDKQVLQSRKQFPF